MNIAQIPMPTKEAVHVIIETPRGSQNKFAYDHEIDMFILKKTLPLGMVFPFDFGFIPNTKGGDGDPLDILVISEGSFYPGCLVECRILGMLKAEQREKKGKPVRNDRLIAVPVTSILYADINRIDQLSVTTIKQLTDFFINYNEIEEKKFIPVKWLPAKNALQLIEKSNHNGINFFDLKV